MAEPTILRFNEIEAFDRGNGVATKLLVNRAIGSEQMTNLITTIQPGAKIALHWHNCDESVSVIEGVAVCEIDGKLSEMTLFDTTFVPAGVPHRFLNQADTQLRIICTYGSSHVTRTFAETGVTVEHMSAQDKATAVRA